MSYVISKKLPTRSISQSHRQHRTLSIALWGIQIVLALIFLFAGSMKLILPIEMMTAQMPLPLPGMFLRFIGLCEVAGALGLILPGVTRIQRRLTPLAALGLLGIMAGAVVLTLASAGISGAVVPLIVGILAACVASGRRSWVAGA